MVFKMYVICCGYVGINWFTALYSKMCVKCPNDRESYVSLSLNLTIYI